MSEYTMPIRRVGTPQDMEKWIESPAYAMVIGFIEHLQESVVGLTNDAEVRVSESVQKVLTVLDEVSTIIQENPVVHEKDVSRFGKVEFRDFYDELEKRAPVMLEPLVRGLDKNPSVELSTYLVESWGNRTRIDYGSGHELHFISFLLCLEQLNIISSGDYRALVLKVFNRYMQIMRTLQKSYWLEPAGSHGVWGLDDYHFLPFLFGASQLSTHPYMKPKSIHNDELVESIYKQYMYLECIHFINTIKTVPTNQGQKLSLRWHSPMLDDISSAKSWMKIKEGMIKMYKAEVLNKLPIIQHFLFGSLIPAPQGLSDPSSHPDDDCGHVHTPEAINTWGDCCGIKVPSALAASEANKRRNNHTSIPFD